MKHADRERIFRLWDEMAAFGSPQTDQAWRRLAETVAGWIGADSVFWAGAVRFLQDSRAARDILCGWRIKFVDFPYPPATGNLRVDPFALWHRQDDPGLTTIAALRGSGRFRVHRLH